MGVGDFVTIKVNVSSRNLDGLQGWIVNIVGEVKPFHYLVNLVGHDKQTVLVRGDELV
jgi:hypothetical protein